MSRKRRQSYEGCSIEAHEGRLRLRYRVTLETGDRKRITRTTGRPDTREARRALEPLREAIGRVLKAGKDPTPILDAYLERPEAVIDAAPGEPLGPTVGSYFARWIVLQVPPLVRPAQARDHRRHLRGYVLERLGEIPLSMLTPSDLRGLQSELLTSGRPQVVGAPEPSRGTPSRREPLSVKTVRNILGGSFRAMLRQARKDGLLTRERLADLMDLEWPTYAPPEPDPFTADERARIIGWFATRTFRVAAAAGRAGYVLQPHPAYHAYLHLLFWSGMRPSEAAGLQWQDVDLERGTAVVRRSRHLWTYGEPKTIGARRTVQLFPETVRLLRALQPLRVEPILPIFPNTRGGPIEPNSLLRHWYAAQRACGIRVRGLYSTKDTFVTTALDAGVKIAWLEQQTGVNYATLRRHYGKWMPSDAARELERFATVEPSLLSSEPRPFERRESGELAPPGPASGATRKKSVGIPGVAECERGDLNPTPDRENPAFSRIATVKDRRRPSRIVPDRHNLAGAGEVSRGACAP
jgi:integrase